MAQLIITWSQGIGVNLVWHLGNQVSNSLLFGDEKEIFWRGVSKNDKINCILNNTAFNVNFNILVYSIYENLFIVILVPSLPGNERNKMFYLNTCKDMILKRQHKDYVSIHFFVHKTINKLGVLSKTSLFNFVSR